MAELAFKKPSESYLNKLRMAPQRGDFSQPKQFCHDIPPKEVVQYHDLGVTPATPHRDDIGRFDRTGGGYVSVAQRVENGQESKIPTMIATTDNRPNENVPENVQKLRPMTAAVRKVESEARVKARAKSAVAGPHSWKDRLETENVKRGKMICSGWKDPETGQSESYVKPPTHVPVDKTKAIWSDPAVKGLVYRSTAQRAMDDVNWDSKLPPALPPPETTVEEHSDPVNEKLRQIRNVRHEEPNAWQKLAKGWDYHQMRNQHLYQKRPYSYSSLYKTGQIPDYYGHVGGFGERDDTYSDFQPIAVKRNPIPPYYGTGRTGNIPGYTGKIWWLGVMANHNNKPVTPQKTTTQTTFIRHHPKSAPPSSFRKQENISKMITAVPPHNPFRRAERETPDPSLQPNVRPSTRTELYA